jgi:hypothetical protein
MAIADREFSSVEVWTVWRGGDGIGPLHEVRGACEDNAAEDMSSAAGGPELRDQGAASEGGFVGVEVIKDFVNDLGG